jgi:preprotein translocase subunit SecF
MNLENLIVTKYKKLLLIPLLLFVVSLAIIGIQYTNNGYVVDKDVSLSGGISATLTLDEYNLEEIQSLLEENFPGSDISIRELSTFGSKTNTGIIIDMTNTDSKELKPFLEENINYNEISIQEMGSGLGESFFKEMIGAIIFAFILMAIVIFIIFRKLVPSLAVIFSAAIDLVGTLAVISLMEIKLSTAGIAAFLMIIGYSVDTDVLLATRLIKRKEGDLKERLRGAFKTGITMTITTIVALTVGFFITNSLIIKQMFGIILIALIFDLISTWIMNTSLLTWYLKRKNEHN